MVITPPEFKEYLIIRYLGPGSDTSETFVSLITRITSDMYFHIFIIYFHLFSVIVLYIILIILIIVLLAPTRFARDLS